MHGAEYYLAGRAFTKSSMVKGDVCNDCTSFFRQAAASALAALCSTPLLAVLLLLGYSRRFPTGESRIQLYEPITNTMGTSSSTDGYRCNQRWPGSSSNSTIHACTKMRLTQHAHATKMRWC